MADENKKHGQSVATPVRKRAQRFSRIVSLLNLVPKQAWLILAMFIVLRVVLTMISLLALPAVPNECGMQMEYSGISTLDLWGRWDSIFYYRIADNGYTQSYEYAWFPLYPLVVRAVAFVVQDIFIAGLLVSNLSLAIACVYLFKLVTLDHDDGTAWRSVRYMILWPTAFVLSAMLTESFYLALLFAAFYHARTGQWWLVGMLGFCLALTKTLGVFVIVPLGLIYLQQAYLRRARAENDANARAGVMGLPSISTLARAVIPTMRSIRPGILFLLLIPLGCGCWALFNYLQTGDPLAFFHIQNTFDRGAFSVLSVLAGSFAGGAKSVINASVAICALLLLVAGVRFVPFSYWLVGLYSLIIPLSTGSDSVPRYTLAMFPFFIMLAQWTRKKWLDITLTIILIIAQCICMAFWGKGLFA